VVLVALFAAVFVYQKYYSDSAQIGNTRGPDASFDNPLYDTAGGAINSSTALSSADMYATPQTDLTGNNNSGYMDVPAASDVAYPEGDMMVTAGTGYMDVSPEIDDLEDV
jgi:hypothetical protein